MANRQRQSGGRAPNRPILGRLNTAIERHIVTWSRSDKAEALLIVRARPIQFKPCYTLNPSNSVNLCGVQAVPHSADQEVTMTENARRPSRFRFRISTFLFLVAILALLVVVVIQQIQMGRMNDARAKEREQLTTIIREMRGYLERQQQR